MNKNLILLWDQDGILVDFVGQACKTFGKDHEKILENWQGQDIETNLGVTKSEFWTKVDSVQNWWEDLPKTEECDELLKIAYTHESYICTSPATNPKCASGKLKWLQKYTKFGRNIVITPQKWLLAKPNVVLIDDTDKQINKFREHGGIGLCFPRPWNQNKHIKDGLDYLKSELERIKNET